MKHKNIVATIYLKNGEAVKSPSDLSSAGDLKELTKLYNDSGIDKILIYDLSTGDEEHEKNIHTVKDIFRTVEIPIYAGGNINRLEDIKKFIYAGCKQVVLNGAKSVSMSLAEEGAKRFGKDRMIVSVKNIDFLFKHKDELDEYFHEMIVLDPSMMDGVENITNLPYVVQYDNYDKDALVDVLKRENVRGICGAFINDTRTDIMKLKTEFAASGIRMDNFAPALKWSDFKLNSDGMVPVVVQDYRTDEVLMVAYMNEEAFNTTISSGKMTYYSRSRKALWMKGETSGHIQYVKSLTVTLIPFLQRYPRLAWHVIPEHQAASLMKLSRKNMLRKIRFRYLRMSTPLLRIVRFIQRKALIPTTFSIRGLIRF